MLGTAAVAIGVLLSGFVLREPAPYELYMAGLVAVWALFGLRISRATAPLLALLVSMNVGGLLALTQMTDLSQGPMYIAVSLFLALTAVFYAPAEAHRFIGGQAIFFIAFTSLLMRFLSSRMVEIGQILENNDIRGGGVYSFSYLVLGPAVSFVATILSPCAKSIVSIPFECSRTRRTDAGGLSGSAEVRKQPTPNAAKKMTNETKPPARSAAASSRRSGLTRAARSMNALISRSPRARHPSLPAVAPGTALGNARTALGSADHPSRPRAARRPCRSRAAGRPRTRSHSVRWRTH